MTDSDDTITVPLVIPAWEAERLSVLIDPDQGLPDLEAVIAEILDHVQQGIYRPGAWERGWLCSAMGEDWLARVEPDDRPERMPEGRVIFDRPVRSMEAEEARAQREAGIDPGDPSTWAFGKEGGSDE